LEQHRAYPAAQHRRVREQKLHRARTLRLEPRMVRDPLARLDRERERVRHLRRPFPQHVLLRQPIERVVDLDARKLPRVEAEHPIVLQILRVERALPFLERVPARPRDHPHDTFLPFFDGFSDASAGAAARLALSASMRSMILPPVSGAASAVISWPATFRSMVSRTRSRTVSLYLVGSNTSVDVWSMSCFANANSAGLTSPSGTVTSVVGLTSSA